jgi:hypothetical protein
MIDIIAYLSQIGDHVVIKSSEFFPEYSPGMDFDIVVPNRHAAIKIVTEDFMKRHINEYALEVSDEIYHAYCDFYKNNILHVRLDFIDSFDFLKKITIDKGFIFRLFQDKIAKQYGNRIVFFPSRENDFFLRYMEYIEYFTENAAKEKHLLYLQTHATNEEWDKLCNMVWIHTRVRHEVYDPKDKPVHYEPFFVRNKQEAKTAIVLVVKFFYSKLKEQIYRIARGIKRKLFDILHR